MDYIGPDLTLRFWSVYSFEPTTPTKSFNALEEKKKKKKKKKKKSLCPEYIYK